MIRLRTLGREIRPRKTVVAALYARSNESESSPRGDSFLIRLLLARAGEEAQQSPPYSADGVNRLHDVAEMFLALAAEKHNKRIRRTSWSIGCYSKSPLAVLSPTERKCKSSISQE